MSLSEFFASVRTQRAAVELAIEACRAAGVDRAHVEALESIASGRDVLAAALDYRRRVEHTAFSGSRGQALRYALGALASVDDETASVQARRAAEAAVRQAIDASDRKEPFFHEAALIERLERVVAPPPVLVPAGPATNGTVHS